MKLKKSSFTNCNLILTDDWFANKPADIQQCFYTAGANNFDDLQKLADCRNNDDQEDCYMQVPAFKNCLQ